MKIIFDKESKKKKQLTFADVEDNQFFVCDDGYLNQRLNETSYSVIAEPDGSPYSGHQICEYYQPIDRIILKIAKIEF